MLLRKNCRGLMAVEVVVAGILISTALATYSLSVIQYRKSLVDSEARVLGLDISNYVRHLFECSKTFVATASDPNKVTECAAASINSSRFIEVRDSNDDILIDRFSSEETAQRIGKLRVRARCVWQEGFNGILLEYRRVVLDSSPDNTSLWQFVPGKVPLSCP